MAGYLSYEEYLSRGGTLAEVDFAACEPRARGRVDALTYGRARRMAAVPEAVKDAMMVAIGVAAAGGAEALAARRDSTRKYQILKRMDREAEEARRRSYAAK